MHAAAASLDLWLCARASLSVSRLSLGLSSRAEIRTKRERAARGLKYSKAVLQISDCGERPTSNLSPDTATQRRRRDQRGAQGIRRRSGALHSTFDPRHRS
eukprot:scaffold24488_cov60-Phaeocystis_antarctica.AAC.2